MTKKRITFDYEPSFSEGAILTVEACVDLTTVSHVTLDVFTSRGKCVTDELSEDEYEKISSIAEEMAYETKLG